MARALDRGARSSPATRSTSPRDFRSFDDGDAERQERLRDEGQRLARALSAHSRPRTRRGPTSGSPTISITRRRTGSARRSPKRSAFPMCSPRPLRAEAGGRPLGHRAPRGRRRDPTRRARSPAQSRPMPNACCRFSIRRSGWCRCRRSSTRRRSARPTRQRSRAAIGELLDLDPDEPWLLTVAMMRDDQKLLSYRCLAEALSRLDATAVAAHHRRRGPGRETRCAALFAPFGDRVRWAGMLAPDALQATLSRRRPLSSGRPSRRRSAWRCSKRRRRGSRSSPGEAAAWRASSPTARPGLLAPEGDAAAFAEAVGALLADPERRLAHGTGRDRSAPRASTTSPSPPPCSISTSVGSRRAR